MKKILVLSNALLLSATMFQANADVKTILGAMFNRKSQTGVKEVQLREIGIDNQNSNIFNFSGTTQEEDSFSQNGETFVVEDLSTSDNVEHSSSVSDKSKRILKKVGGVGLVGGSFTLMSLSFAPTFWSPVVFLGLKGMGVRMIYSIFFAGSITGVASRYAEACCSIGTRGVSLGSSWFFGE